MPGVHKPPRLTLRPPGPADGQYKPLSEHAIQQIYQTALRILAELGMGDVPPQLMQQALKLGANVNRAGRLCYPVSMVEDIIAGACRHFVFYGRDPKHDFEIGGDKVRFGTGGAAVPVGTSFTVAATVDPIIDMFDLALGGAVLIDDEMLSQVYRVLRGIEVNEETLGFAAIEEAIYGEGHFLGSQQTMAAMQGDYFWPSKLTDRQQPAVWQEQGATDMWQRANVRVREILAEHQPEYLSPAVDRQIRERYQILL